MDVLQSIDKALSPLSSLTDILSGEGYVTISTVLPMLQLIESSLLKKEEDDTELSRDTSLLTLEVVILLPMILLKFYTRPPSWILDSSQNRSESQKQNILRIYSLLNVKLSLYQSPPLPVVSHPLHLNLHLQRRKTLAVCLNSMRTDCT